MLAVHPKPGRTPKIRGEIRARLERELQDPEGLGSYKEVQQWLQGVCGLNVAYKTVHGVEAFKKTLDASLLKP